MSRRLHELDERLRACNRHDAAALSPKLQLLPLCAAPHNDLSGQTLPAEKKLARLYLWKSYESAAHLHLNMGSQQMKPTITVSADHKVSVLVVVLIRHHFKKSPGCISVMRNKNIPIENKTRSLFFSRRKRLSKDLNLPEDVNVCGVTGSAPPLSHQHRSMSSLLSDL